MREITGNVDQVWPPGRSAVHHGLAPGLNTPRNPVAHNEMTVRKGDRAPLFTLCNTKGIPRAFADYLARGPALLGFHRGTW